jgi:hypothetical protein
MESIRERNFCTHDFSKDEVDVMKRDASTSATMNEVRHDARLGGPDVTMRGIDESNAELKAAWQHEDVLDVAPGTSLEIAFAAAEHFTLGPAAPFTFAREALKTLAKAEERGEALAENNKRSAMHLGMLTALDLPQGYKDAEVARWRGAGIGSQSHASRLGTALATYDQKHAALLQLHADRGMNAARHLCDAGILTAKGDAREVERALATDASSRAKYENDPAYRSGFDAFVWSMRKDTPAVHRQTVDRLEARDARYSQHAISLRG